MRSVSSTFMLLSTGGLCEGWDCWTSLLMSPLLLPLLLVSQLLAPLLPSSSPGSAYRAALRLCCKEEALKLSDAPIAESWAVDNAAGASEYTAVLAA